MTVASMIKSHELFRALSFEEIERVSGYSGAKNYDAGGIVYQRHDRATHFFVVLEGKVHIKLPSTDGECQLLVGRMEKGDIFGLSPFLGFESFMATAQCACKSSVLAVEAAPFRLLLEDNSAVGLRVNNIIAKAYFSRYLETLARFQHVLDGLSPSSASA
ncbi:MAG: cyclic nucleotide-binding domain-containing protein [Deltaproteobacteria bacterium]|jgi:CRP-like cAMP-binding protein|nr:cyclic nucleotide-binding domain-containing protein [Deltaproteobacteria bacterium]MBW2532013.1 cyclic nucleotide-binding domain-containing protein [Deltaproteobacteria bacterium]